jgi:hypothetical protein
MNTLGELKQNDTFKVEVSLFDGVNPYPVDTATITSKVETEDETFNFDLTVTKSLTDANTFTVEGQTSTWPIGNVLWDVRVVEGTFSWSLPTHIVVIGKRVS